MIHIADCTGSASRKFQTVTCLASRTSFTAITRWMKPWSDIPLNMVRGVVSRQSHTVGIVQSHEKSYIVHLSYFAATSMKPEIPPSAPQTVMMMNWNTSHHATELIPPITVYSVAIAPVRMMQM